MKTFYKKIFTFIVMKRIFANQAEKEYLIITLLTSNERQY